MLKLCGYLHTSLWEAQAAGDPDREFPLITVGGLWENLLEGFFFFFSLSTKSSPSGAKEADRESLYEAACHFVMGWPISQFVVGAKQPHYSPAELVA